MEKKKNQNEIQFSERDNLWKNVIKNAKKIGTSLG